VEVFKISVGCLRPAHQNVFSKLSTIKKALHKQAYKFMYVAILIELKSPSILREEFRMGKF